MILTLADGARQVVVTSDADSGPSASSWSPDGTRLAYWRITFDANGHVATGRIHLIGTDGTGDVGITDIAPQGRPPRLVAGWQIDRVRVWRRR